MPEFLHFTKMSLAENKAITFPYYFKQIDTFYDVVLKGTHHNNIVDISAWTAPNYTKHNKN